MNEKEQNNRNKLKESKPLVYEKVIKYNMPRIQFQCTYQCNFKCEFCSIDKMKDNTREVLSLEQIRSLFQQAHEIGISRITLTGGEPILLGKKLEDIIEVIDPKKFWIQLDSNAWFLSKKKVKHLKEIGIDCIAPSLDSLYPEEHDTYRKAEGSAERVIKSFDYIQEVGLNTFVQTIVGKTRLYSKEFIDFVKYFNNRNIGVYVGFCKPVGAFEGQLDEVLDRKDIEYLEQLEKEYKICTHLSPAYGVNEERNCVASRNIFGISAYGDVFPCIFFFASMGNVLNEPLKDIIERSQRLKPFKVNTCPLGDRDSDLINSYLIPKMYGKKLPVPWQDVFNKDDFEE